jgi:hypothetical protein
VHQGWSTNNGFFPIHRSTIDIFHHGLISAVFSFPQYFPTIAQQFGNKWRPTITIKSEKLMAIFLAQRLGKECLESKK